jgi:hypothetical protein
MVGVAGLLRLARWWRQRDAGSPERGDGSVFPEAENAGTSEAERGTGDGVVGGTDVGGVAAGATTAAGRHARNAGAADSDGEGRR